MSAFSSRCAVEDAQDRIDKEINDYETAIRSLKQRRNALSFVSRLPPEVLGKIFECTRTSIVRENAKSLGWLKVGHVCLHWRNVALDPHLWSHVDFIHLESVEQFLGRSKAVPLTVEIDINSRTAKKIGLVWTHASRIRGLRIAPGDIEGSQIWLGEILSQLVHAAPLLQFETFTFENSLLQVLGRRFPNDFFAGNLCSLRQLELRNCTVSWGSSIFSQLTSLRLSLDTQYESDVYMNVRPSTSELLTALSNMHNLKVLHLRHIFPSVATQSFPSQTSERNILLPRLSSFLVVSNARTCSPVLDRLILPSLSLLDVTCTVSNDRPQFSSFLPTLVYWGDPDRLGDQGFHHYLTLSLHRRPGTMLFQAWRKDTQSSTKAYLRLQILGVDDMDSIILSVCKALPMQALEVLRACDLGEVGKKGWLDCFGLSRLKSLYVLNHTEAGLIQALSAEAPVWNRFTLLAEAESPESPSSSLYFPDLRDLEIEGWNFKQSINGKTCFERLVSCLRKRDHRQLRIQKLRLTSCRFLSPSQVEKLKKLVHEVVWDGIEIGR